MSDLAKAQAKYGELLRDAVLVKAVLLTDSGGSDEWEALIRAVQVDVPLAVQRAQDEGFLDERD